MRVNTVLTSLLLLLVGVGLTVDANAQSEKKGSSTSAGSSAKKGEPSSSSTKSAGAKDSGSSDASSKYTSVKLGKVEEFKPLWRSVKTIQDSITGFETQLTATRNGLKGAAGVALDRPLKSAFDGMKKQAVVQTKDRVKAVVASAQKIVGFVSELAPRKP